jgi:branched-chain amino acid transport system permease protein
MTSALRGHWGLIGVGVIGIALMVVLPLTLDLFELLQITLYAIFGILALSLAFIWGYGGISASASRPFSASAPMRTPWP